MTIYILDNDPAKCAQMLDDKSLNKMIKDIAQVLCNAHVKDANGIRYTREDNPIRTSCTYDDKWSQWAREVPDFLKDVL